VTGKPNPLVSSFKLSYYTLLNLLRRVEGSGHDMEHVIRNSFQQYQFEQSLPQVRRKGACASRMLFAAFAWRVLCSPASILGSRMLGACVTEALIQPSAAQLGTCRCLTLSGT